MTTANMTIKILLKDVLKKKGLSYRQASEMVFGDESSAPTLHRLANGKWNPRLETIDKICLGLNCKLDELIRFTKK